MGKNKKEIPSPNFTSGTEKEKKSNTKKKGSKKFFKFFSYSFVIFITILIAFSSQILVTGQSSTSWLSKIPIIGHLQHLAESADKKLKGENDDRINVLLLGMGGIKHEGSYLTDTIILASLEPSTKKVAMVSIPRDLAVTIENIGLRKINNVNAFAEVQKEGSGGLAVSQAVSDLLNIPIDYYVRVDFEGFTNIVDHMDGVNIYVENTLDDYSYPVMGREEAEPYESRFEHLHIEKGWQTMDGGLALKYARSRHAGGIEGSDFARAKRQQKVIEAVKDKSLSKYTLFRPDVILNILNELEGHVDTNLQLWEMIKLWNLFKDTTSDKIINKVLDNSPNGLLVDTISEDGAYILIPKSGDFTELQYFVYNIFSDAPKEERTKVSEERATIEIRNGTWINGLASQVALDLEKYGFTVIRIGNSSKQNFQKTVIYDLTYGEKMKSLTILKNKTDANVAFGLPEWLIDDLQKELNNESNPEQPDFIIILGQEADKTESGTVNPDE